MFKWILLSVTILFWIIFIFSCLNESDQGEINLTLLSEKIRISPSQYISKEFVPDISAEYYIGFEFINKNDTKDFGKYFDFDIISDGKKNKIRKSISPLINSGDDIGYGYFDLVEGEKYTLNLRFDSIPKNMINDSIKLRICCSQAAVSVGLEYGKSFNKEYGSQITFSIIIILILLTIFVIFIFLKNINFKLK